MKKILFSLLVLCISTTAFSQWVTSGTNIYFNTGNVGIGTSTLSHTLTIKGGPSGFKGINLLETNSRFYFDGLRAMEGNSSLSRLDIGEGFSKTQLLGNIGIGTGSPATKLHISGDNAELRLTGGTHTSIRMMDGGTGDPGYIQTLYDGNIDAQVGAGGTYFAARLGNVGIGTDSPNDLLHISKSASNTRLRLGNNAAYDQLLYFNGAADWSMGMDNSNSNAFTIASTSSLDNSQRFTILNNGNTGIGTTTPHYPLSVAGVINSEANGDYYGAWFGGEARTADPSINVGEWHNYKGKIYWDNSDRKLVFETKTATTTFANTLVLEDGNVGMGVINPSEKLEVNGNALINGELYSKKVKVSVNPGNWPDYVFAPSYKLRSLGELEEFIAANHHLPEVPSAKVVEKDGLDLGQMDATLLQKVEELTLYLINVNNKQEQLIKEVESLKKENAALKKKVNEQ